MPTGPGLYSRVVAVLKVLLPLVALGLLSALFLIQNDDTSGGALEFSEGDTAALGEGLRITNPTFTGATDAGDRFRFSAEIVVPNAAPPSRADVEALTGRIDFTDGRRVEVSAAGGELDLAGRMITLAGDVTIETSDGYRTRADRMLIDMAAGRLESGDAVATTGPLGRIDSGNLVIEPTADAGARRFSFGNGVRLVYDPPPAVD